MVVPGGRLLLMGGVPLYGPSRPPYTRPFLSDIFHMWIDELGTDSDVLDQHASFALCAFQIDGSVNSPGVRLEFVITRAWPNPEYHLNYFAKCDVKA